MINTTVIGASGYTGAELLRLLISRDDIQIDKILGNTSIGKKLSDVFPAFASTLDLEIEKFNMEALNSTDIVFTALPPGEALKIIPQIYALNIPIIDLGGDFRLNDPVLYQHYYKIEHTAPELLNKSVYGLPELYKETIENANFVSNPGCYATSVILSLIPALKYNIIDPRQVVINSLSGITGAGKKETLDYSFTELNENVRAYKITDHQHIPEIEQVLKTETGVDSISLSFVPHLVPINRGIYTTISTSITNSISEQEIYKIYEEFYYDAPFVRLKNTIPQVKDILYTNYCDIFLTLDRHTNRLIIISVLDNLMKGAAGQAMQNMNIMFKLSETLGFLKLEKLHV